MMGDLQAQLTHNDRDKGGHEAHDLEASRNFFFPFLPRVLCFSFNDRAVLVRNSYGLRAISGATTCGLCSISVSHLNRSIIREEKRYPG